MVHNMQYKCAIFSDNNTNKFNMELINKTFKNYLHSLLLLLKYSYIHLSARYFNMTLRKLSIKN